MTGGGMRTYGNESGDLLSVLDELHTHTLADGRIGLLRFNADLFEDDALRVRRASSGRCLIEVTESALFVRFVRLEKWPPKHITTVNVSVCMLCGGSLRTHPAVVPTGISELACCLQSAGLIGYDEGINSINGGQSI
jgi:hypothetical protein